MSTTRTDVTIPHTDRFYIGGAWVEPSSSSSFTVEDSATEDPFLTVAEAQAPDMDRAVSAAREAFDRGPWSTTTPAERAGYMRALADAIRKRSDVLAQIWPRESGATYKLAENAAAGAAKTLGFYADMAETFPFEAEATPTNGNFGMLVREPVGVVGAIVPWNSPLGLIGYKLAPALLAGCTMVLKLSPEAPGAGYVVAEAAQEIGLPPGVFNVVTANREVSELLVRDPRVDKITFTGSTAAGRRIGSIMGERIGRFTLELGGKSAAVILDDADIATTARTLAGAECRITGQVCASLTRIVIDRKRQDELVEALAHEFAQVQVGDPFDPAVAMGPLATQRQRDRVEGYIDKGQAEGAVLVTGGGRPKHLDRGWYVEPTIFAQVDNSSTIAQEEIFGPVLSVIPADSEDQAIDIANDTIYGLNSSVFTPDVDRARAVARRLRSGTVGHNDLRGDFGIAFGGFKQSGVGREGGVEGVFPYTEAKTVVLDARPTGF